MNIVTTQNDTLVIPSFGSLVKANAFLVRSRKVEYNDDRYRTQKTMKIWQSKHKKITGIFLGTRTLQNGELRYDDDYGYYFIPKQWFSAVLLCPSPTKNPIYVPLDSIYE